ncbi:hypothetical protein PNI0008_01685 [Streptococcus pneumoniae PNI0008]|nr:hypothetical protein HMPREF1038_00302 [Streptococcus pneumoniae gamPNI0373]ELU60962.1 hypothetical protein PCS125219_00191 [Streptococcus pneumoniae PCS125219]ELU63394.1 hypothetical protein PCS70012_01616 [Streptococcus pneumoniae PCS70012]ELU65301.1 hypothetical protein PNI0002_01023 [Streptococcus pneumoniae PNI0002]ELU68247.1 hypothetical protein PNI0006_00296 [Streptococcus pneumoniae PNI0006]ELU70021.1 hypothetical protein PCS81218_00681 [Streptococcus pneumoniae PCS81218]ELU71190.1 
MENFFLERFFKGMRHPLPPWKVFCDKYSSLKILEQGKIEKVWLKFFS